MGWVDTSLPFGENVEALNKVYHTPNMERMAKNGMLFSDAYATPVCTPSRVSMLTGMNAAHHQVTNWTSIVKDQPSDRDDGKFERLEWNHNGFSPAQIGRASCRERVKISGVEGAGETRRRRRRRGVE